MRLAIISLSRDKVKEKLDSIRNISINKRDPEFVLVYGGDGTILRSEWDYPGVPKIVFRKHKMSSRSPSYTLEELEKVLESIERNEFTVVESEKVEAFVKGKTFFGLNEVQVRTKIPWKALRFSIALGNKDLGKIIGDGLIVATSHGSTGYYRAMGHKPFTKGVKLGLNNALPRIKPISLGIEKARVMIIRERAMVVADNNEDFLELGPGDMVEIKQSHEKARFVKL